MTASIISAAAMVIVAIIEAVAARDRKRDKQERAQMQERQELQEQLMLELIKGNWASVALGEARRRPYSVFPMRIAMGICMQRSTTLRRSNMSRKSF